MATGDYTEFWAARLKSFIPRCVYQDDQTTEAAIYGIAAIFDELSNSLDKHFIQTFICNAVGAYLNEHGIERGLTRAASEIDASFQQRIKNITNSSNCPAIKALVDALLEVGEATIQEDDINGVFFSAESFFNRGEILIDPIINTFSIVVDKQVHAPYSFYDREYFMDREDFIGTNESSLELFQLIVQAVNEAKACGTAYRLIETIG